MKEWLDVGSEEKANKHMLTTAYIKKISPTFAHVHQLQFHTHRHTHSCHENPHKSATIPIPLWLLVLYRRVPSICRCMSQHFGMTFASSKLKKTTIDTASVTDMNNNEINSKVKHWIHLSRGFTLYLAEARELEEKAAAGSPADISWPGRHCLWLKGSSMLEVFGIDCSKLHHKTPLKGNAVYFT